MPYEYTLTTVMPASAREVYEAWLDSLAHSEMTGGEASMSDEVDAQVSAWDGYIAGRNLHLVPNVRIVQAWRTTQFTDEHEDSVITLSFEETGAGTLLTLVHSNVPDGQTSYERGGWQTHYFEPMKAYFATRRQTGAGQSRNRDKPKRATKRMGKPARPRGARAEPARSTPTSSSGGRKPRAGSAEAAPKAMAKASSPKPKAARAKAAAPRSRTAAGGTKRKAAGTAAKPIGTRRAGPGAARRTAPRARSR